jgi:hypothetical protein
MIRKKEASASFFYGKKFLYLQKKNKKESSHEG